MDKYIFALGYFDGVHLGHQALLTQCKKLAQGKKWGAVTFLGHPDELLKGIRPGLINQNADRDRLLQIFGAEKIVHLSFDKKLMNTPWDSFLDMLVRDHGAEGFVCGSDFYFGAQGAGTAALLQTYCAEHNLQCAVVPQQMQDGQRISSTCIRSLLEQGDVEKANRLLGHPHTLWGVVEQGKQLGRTIGVPTANIGYSAELVKLPYGVYECNVTVEKCSYKAITNVGKCPTVSGQKLTVESHLLGFDGDLYGKTVQVEFLRFLRPEQKFDSLQALQNQIAQDIKSIL